MSLYVLDAFIWIVGIRGHIPHSGGPVPVQSFVSAGTVLRALGAFVVMVALMSLVLWLGVSLAIELL